VYARNIYQAGSGCIGSCSNQVGISAEVGRPQSTSSAEAQINVDSS